MFELFILGIVGLVTLGPIFFVIWTIKRIHDLSSMNLIQGNELEMLNNRLIRLQHELHKTQENLAQAKASREIQPEQTTESKAATETAVTPPSTLSATAEKTSSAKIPDKKPVSATDAAVLNSDMPPVNSSGQVAGENAISAALKENPANAEGTPAFTSPDEPAELMPSDYAKHQPEPLPEPMPAPDKQFIPRREYKAQPELDWTANDMESLIGGNLMSKLGALLLVIGLALFLSYSLGSMGPLAKLAAGAILGTLLLVWGSILDHRQSGDTLSIGLIGGGWACLFLTAFASYGVEATRIFSDPLPGMAAMLTVATGMIIHSLKFKSEMATGLAFLLAFTSLFITEVNMFSEIAAVVLTLAMLGLSYHYSWHQLSVAGLMLTYGSMLARLQWRAAPSNAPVIEQLTFVQSMLMVNWITFEMMSMNFLRRGFGEDSEPTRFLFPMNFAAYGFVSAIVWLPQKQISVSVLVATIAIQYVISGLLRGFWCQRPGEAAVEKQQFFLGSLEDSLTISALATMLWLWYALPAPVIVIGWALLGLLALEIALRMPWQLLRFTGHLIVSASFLRVFIANFAADGLTMGISHRVLTVVPMIALMIHLYIKTDEEIDWESSPTGASRAFSPVYSYFATMLAAFLIRFEAGPGLTPPLWALAAIVLVLAGRKFNSQHISRQGTIIALGAAGYGLSTDLGKNAAMVLFDSPWIVGPWIAISLFACRSITLNKQVEANESLIFALDSCRKEIFSLTACSVLVYLLYLEISGSFLTLSWAALGIAFLLSGFFIRDRLLRLTGLGLALLCILKLFIYDARVLEAPLRILAFICLGGALILISFVYNKFKDRFQELL